MEKSSRRPDMSVNIAGVELKNPVMTASGTFGSGMEYADFVELDRLGAVVTKGVAAVPWEGNPTPRVCETPSGMLNAIGLQNLAQAFATLVLGHEGEHLQDDVAEERPDKVFPTPGIQKGHVDYADVDTLFLCQDAPLFQYLGVVPAQAVNALDIEQITPFQLPQQLPVLRPLEVLSTLLIRIDIAILNTVFVHGNDLSVFILIFCADSHITIAIAQSFLLSVKPAAGSARSSPPDYLS